METAVFDRTFISLKQSKMTTTKTQVMKTDQMYRWSVTTADVYQFLGFYGEGYNASTLASSRNQVSGFIKKSDVRTLLSALTQYGGHQALKFKLVTSERYWKNFDMYNN